MKFKDLFLTIIAYVSISSQAFACNTVMNGCSKELTHDTSTHMKSQIVNRVEKQDLGLSSASSKKTNLKNRKNVNQNSSVIKVLSKSVVN